MSRCISQTGRMRSEEEEEEVGMGRKPGCRDSQTRKASSVKAKHKNRMIFNFFFLSNKQTSSLHQVSKSLDVFSVADGTSPLREGSSCGTVCWRWWRGWRWLMSHTHTVYTHTHTGKAQQHVGAMALSWCKGRWGRLSVSTENKWRL